MPLPWHRAGGSFGFGADGAHLPPPWWFGDFSVEAEEADPASTLNLYRRALWLRRDLQDGEVLTWHAHPSGSDEVLWFERPGGWHSVTNFGDAPVDLPAGEVLVTSVPLVDGRLPGAATAWLRG